MKTFLFFYNKQKSHKILSPDIVTQARQWALSKRFGLVALNLHMD